MMPNEYDKIIEWKFNLEQDQFVFDADVESPEPTNIFNYQMKKGQEFHRGSGEDQSVYQVIEIHRC